MKLSGLYAITDEKWTPPPVIMDAVLSALHGGASIIQLRDKHSSSEELLPLAVQLAELCRENSALFIINDRVELAEQCDCHGLHIGRDDCGFREARKRLPDKIIGVSCYDDLQLAMKFQDEGADYVAFGSFFPSPTKPDAVRAEIDLLAMAKEKLDIPICAIGGITPDNATRLVEAGADMLAVISGLWECGSILERARELTLLVYNTAIIRMFPPTDYNTAQYI